MTLKLEQIEAAIVDSKARLKAMDIVGTRKGGNEFYLKMREASKVNEETKLEALKIAHKLELPPSENVWSGLPRDVQMGFDLGCRTYGELKSHLRRITMEEGSERFKKELDRPDEQHISKGDCVVLIWEAMKYELTKELESEK